MKKHAWKILLTAALLMLVNAAFFSGCRKQEDGEKVPVEKVGVITGADTASYDRFAGLVVSKDTVSVTKDENKEIKEVYIKVGDIVRKGAKLFSYDLDDLNLTIEQKKLEIEKSENEIAGMNEELEELERLSSWAYGSQALEYSIRIRETKNNLREAEYNLAGMKTELEKLEESVENVDVLSPCEGRIQSISDGSQSYDPFTGEPTGDPNAYITILELGTYRVKGTINEMNVDSLSVGAPVLVRSRIDDGKIWHGTVDSIDWDNPVKDSGGYYYYSDEMTSSSKYPFYISMDSVEGLLLGEHVYIEPDLGQNEEKSGLWLPAFYLVQSDTETYVWAEDGSRRLEKRSVELGEYSAELDTWEIAGGLSADDYIAFPQDSLREGTGTVRADEMPEIEDVPAVPGGFEIPEKDMYPQDAVPQFDDSVEDYGEVEEKAFTGFPAVQEKQAAALEQ